MQTETLNAVMEIDHLRLQTQKRKVSLIQWRRSDEFEFSLRFVDFADMHQAASCLPKRVSLNGRRFPIGTCLNSPPFEQ
jgi:hypothetical protein